MDPYQKCDCIDCYDSETPCHCDCDRDQECTGCYDARMEQEETYFDIRKAQGA